MFEDIEVDCIVMGQGFGFEVVCKQFNYEGEIVEMIYEVCEMVVGIIINLVVYLYILVVIFDVLNIFDGLVIEVYILNIYKCEVFCYYFYVLVCVDGVIVGCGVEGYMLVILWMGLLLCDFD